MRRYLYLGLLALGIVIGACIHHLPSLPGVAVLEAQSFPFTIHAEINPNAVSDAVTSYTFVWNGGTPVVVTNLTLDPVCHCIKSPPFTVLAAGNVTATITATNQWGTSSPLVLTANVTGPGMPTGGAIKSGS